MKHLFFGFFLLLSVFKLNAQSIVITEIMYNIPGTDTLEYIELYNAGNTAIDLNGYTFTEGVVFIFSSTIINPGEYLLLTENALSFTNSFGLPSMAWFSGGLSNNGEDLVLYDNNGNLVDSVDYKTIAPWPTGPVSPDGGGASLVLCDPLLDNNDPSNWIADVTPTGVIVEGIELLGHPGSGCPSGDLSPPIPIAAEALSSTQVKITFNEIVTNSAEIASNYQGLSVGTATLDVTGMMVTLDLSSPLPDGIVVPITINNVTDLIGNTMTIPVVLEVIWYSQGPLENFVITEIMYNPPDTLTDDIEFIEIRNISGQNRNILGMQIAEGVDYVFPNMVVNDGDYVVVAKNAAAFFGAFGFTPLQWTSGSLRNSGEEIRLADPVGRLIELVDYNDGSNGIWPLEADGLGYSLVLCDPFSDNNDPSNWTIASTSTGVFQLGIEVFANPAVPDPICPTSVDQIFFSEVVIYPNPAHENLYIKGDENLISSNFQLFDSFGRVVKEGQILDYQHEINIKNLASGIYILKLFNKKIKSEIFTQKVVIFG